MAATDATEAAAVPIVTFDKVSLAFDDTVVLQEISFSIRPGRLTVLLGASGSGKSVVLKLIMGLLKPDSGAVYVNGARIDTMSEAELMAVRADVGMLFQESALFDSLDVAGNVGYRLEEEIHLPAARTRKRVEEVLNFIGLHDFIEQMPAELSGGQRRRVAIARAIAARPHLLLFDDPTSGLDPITAKTVTDEIIKLRDLEGVTPIVVTHQLPDAFYIARHEAVMVAGVPTICPASAQKAAEAEFIVLKDGCVYFDGSLERLSATHDRYLSSFLVGWVPPLV